MKTINFGPPRCWYCGRAAHPDGEFGCGWVVRVEWS